MGLIGTFHDSAPSFTKIYGEKSEPATIEYDRFGRHESGIEPLILVRSFHGLKPEVIEIIEEFRLFHNLFFDSSKSTFVKFDDCGDEIEVIRVSEKSVDIRRKEIRQFLAVRDMSLAVYFENMYYSHLDVEELNIAEGASITESGNAVFELFVGKWDGSSDFQSFSAVLGKTIIKGLPREKSGIWPFDQEFEKNYEEFIIGINEDDEPISYTSNPDKLADYFGKNRHSPHYLTSVFFRREVLAKYYGEQQKYKVEDGLLWCGSKWVLRLDNNHPDYVIVFLGDLGRDLPHTEQIHWKSYNVQPDGRMSDTNIRRSFEAEFAEPQDSALIFRDAYERLSMCWREKLGWNLFKPLSGPDNHHFATLRRPLTREPSELDEIMLSLSKLLIDSLNVRKIKKEIPDFEAKDARGNDKKSITILEEYLNHQEFGDSNEFIKCLRTVQDLRSASAAHRKGKNFEKVSESVGLESRTPQDVADDIFTTLTAFLDSLRTHFCPDETD